MTNYWVSWYATEANGPYEIHTPWWCTGWRLSDDAETICAALKAKSEHDAMEQIYRAYDQRPDSIEFRFVEPRPDDWSPFDDRFQRAEWLGWLDD